MPHKKLFQPFKYNGRFYNHAEERYRSTFLPSLIMLCEWYWDMLRKGRCDSAYWYAPVDPLHRTKHLAITWVGHATFLIQVAGINILTDPVFGDLPFFKRQLQAGIPIEKVPEIDYVIISHNHRDHMDRTALTFFKGHPETTFLVPLGDKAWFERRGFTRVREYSWWEQDRFTHHEHEIEFSFLPALHWSQRGLRDFNTSLWGSWVIRVGNESVYFAGDTAYGGHFSAIKKEFPTLSHALMPIGPCEPRRWMQDSHMNAEEAGQAFLDLGARKFLPMHWGTFNFGTDHHEAPYERIVSWWQKQQLSEQELIVLKAGQRLEQLEKESIIQSTILPATQIERIDQL